MGSDSKLVPAAGARGSPAAICCMCGDHGLLPELFRCAACSSRYQHTYVSYLVCSHIEIFALYGTLVATKGGFIFVGFLG